jgi:anti-sigma-K factor RskA
MNEDDDLMAAEWALGLLDGAEAEAAAARISANPALLARADWWRGQLAGLAGEGNIAPREALWARISAALPTNDNNARLTQRWRATALAMMALTVGLMSFIVLRPVPVGLPTPTGAPKGAHVLLASLVSDQTLSATIAFDPAQGTLAVAPAAIEVGAGDAELWIIAADGAANSLGVIDTHTAATHKVAPAHRSLIAPGTSFAITREPRGGSPTGRATGPIIASGKIIAT